MKGWMIMREIWVTIEEPEGYSGEEVHEFTVDAQLLPDLLKWCKWAEKYGGVDDQKPVEHIGPLSKDCRRLGCK